ncbi:MAG: hypothetical protein GY828_04255 [Candidatus Gracilibacteria bacterium]|nr:hypothetical protein [Candidatus Gracilibacteria bacterium]
MKHIKRLFRQSKWKRVFAENTVVEHDKFFYKTPSIVGKKLFHDTSCPYDNNRESYELIREKFGKDFHVAVTEILQDKEYGVIIKQEKISGSILSKKDLLNTNIQKDLVHLLDINKKLWKERGLFLDILGTDCLYKPFHLHNLMLHQNSLVLFDFGLLNKNASNVFFRFFSHLFFHVQCFWIEKIILPKQK